MAVVVPARNEADRLPRCLNALMAADSFLRAGDAGVNATRMVVVLDRCTDASESLLADWPAFEVLISDEGNVGAARAAGIDHLLADHADKRPRPDWIACTDADSAVPADWLVTQLRHAGDDTDLLLGLVSPDPAELSAHLLRRWKAAHHLADGHHHVHGANLGVRTAMYRQVGGFQPVAVHEDVMLADRIALMGGRVVRTASSPVLTSARTTGRAPGGMAGYLTELTLRDDRKAPAPIRQLADFQAEGQAG